MTENWLSGMHDGCNRVRDVSRELASLASSLYHVGNDRLGKELLGLANEIAVAEVVIRDSVYGHVHAEADRSLATTKDMAEGIIGLLCTIKK